VVTARRSAASHILRASCMLTDQVGDAVYIRSAMNSFYKVAKANPAILDKMPATGVIIKKWGYTNVLIQVAGEIRGVYDGLSPGRQYWVGPDARPVRFTDLSSDPGTRYLAQELGSALDLEVLLLSPSHIVTSVLG